MTDYHTITIPAQRDHGGTDAITITVPWHCLTCGGPRDEPMAGLSFDGSLRMAADHWGTNPCGHSESYAMVRDAFLGTGADRIYRTRTGWWWDHGPIPIGPFHNPQAAFEDRELRRGFLDGAGPRSQLADLRSQLVVAAIAWRLATEPENAERQLEAAVDAYLAEEERVEAQVTAKTGS